MNAIRLIRKILRARGRVRRRFGALFALGLAAMTLTACLRKRVPPSEQALMSLPARPASLVQPGPGSLWPGFDRPSWSLVRDDKALDVGDIVVVNVVTNTTAEEKAATDTSRKAGILADVTNFFGHETNIPRTLTPLGGDVPPLISASSTSSFEGDASTSRSGKITSRVSCIVTQVYVNGNMRIHGTEGVGVNNEKSVLTVDGVIRPSDISIDNTILSTRIADAQIRYTGHGAVADVQHPGIVLRAFGVLWPF